MIADPNGNRRQFIAALAGAAVALPFARAAQPTGTSAGRGTLHVFAKPLQWLSYAETAALVAEAGYGGIDFAVRPGGHIAPARVREDLPRAVDAARAAGLKVEMITTGITDPRRADTEAVIATAAGLGVKYYRLGRFDYDLAAGIWPSIERLRPVVRDLAALNEAHGIHGAIQNHAGTRIGAVGWDIFSLVRDVDPRWLGCQFDIRHAVVEGGQSWPVTLRLLRPWIRCTDLKDFRWTQRPGSAAIENVPIGQGIVNFAEYFRLVRELGITGPQSVHFEYPPFEHAPEAPPGEKRARLLAAMRQDRLALERWIGDGSA